MLLNLIEKNKMNYLNMNNNQEKTEKVDISSYQISSHALMRYSTKCKPGLSIEMTLQYMKKMMREVELSDRGKVDGSISYVDRDGNMYVTKNNLVLTNYPSNRILFAKPLIKKRGRKYL